MKHYDYRHEDSRGMTMVILKLALAGALVVGVAAAPGLGYVYQHFKSLDKRKRELLCRKMNSLTRSGYLTRSQAGYALTEEGKQVLDEEGVWNLKPKIPKRWDGKWHVLLFDIPGKKETGRHALRERLEELGYYHYQDSVYVHRHDLRSVIEPFANFYDVRDHIRFMVAIKL